MSTLNIIILLDMNPLANHQLINLRKTQVDPTHVRKLLNKMTLTQTHRIGMDPIKEAQPLLEINYLILWDHTGHITLSILSKTLWLTDRREVFNHGMQSSIVTMCGIYDPYFTFMTPTLRVVHKIHVT